MERPGMLSSESCSGHQSSKMRMLLHSRGDNLLSTLPKGISSYLFTPSWAWQPKLALTKCRGWFEPLRGLRFLVLGCPA